MSDQEKPIEQAKPEAPEKPDKPEEPVQVKEEPTEPAIIDLEEKEVQKVLLPLPPIPSVLTRDLTNPNQELFEMAFAQLKDQIQGEITPDSIIKSVMLATMIVQKLKQGKIPLTAEAKKEFVMKMIDRLVKETDQISQENRFYLVNFFIPTLLGPQIDALVGLGSAKDGQGQCCGCLIL